jgi:hypothetical protein
VTRTRPTLTAALLVGALLLGVFGVFGFGLFTGVRGAGPARPGPVEPSAPLAPGDPPEPAGAGVSAPASPAPSTDFRLTAGLTDSRRYQQDRILLVTLHNRGAAPVRVERLQLSTGLFTMVPPEAKDTVLAPTGQRLDLPVAYGPPQCSGPSAGRPSPPVALMSVRNAEDTSAAATDLRVSIRGATKLLDLRHALECRQRAAQEAADISFGSSWKLIGSGRQSRVRSELVVRRRASQQKVTVTEVGGGIIFGVRLLDERDGPAVRLPAGRRRAVAALEISASRCDPHALIESKRTFTFTLYVRLGGAPEVFLPLEATGEGRRLLEESLARCAPR